MFSLRLEQNQDWILAFLTIPAVFYLFLRGGLGEELAQIIYSCINLFLLALYFLLNPKAVFSRILVSFSVLILISFFLGCLNVLQDARLAPFLVSFNGALQLLVGLWWGSQRNVRLESVLNVAWLVVLILVFAEVGNRLIAGNGLASMLFNNSHVFLLMYVFFGFVERRFMNSAFLIVFCYTLLTGFSYYLDSDFAREQYKVIVYIASALILVFSFKFLRGFISSRFTFLIFLFMVFLIIYLFDVFGSLASDLPVSREGSLYYRISVFEHIVDKFLTALPWSLAGFGAGSSAYSIPGLLGLSSHSGISDVILEFGLLSVCFLVFSYPLRSNFSRNCWLGIWLFWFSVNLLNNSLVPSALFEYQTGLTFFGFILAYINRGQHAVYLGLSEFYCRKIFKQKV